MMKKSKKRMVCIFAVFMMMLLLPFTARAAIMAGAGEGTEENPHILTVGYGEKDTFSYTGQTVGGDKYTYYSYLKLSFRGAAAVTMSTEGGAVTYKKSGSTWWQQIPPSGINVKKDEFILVCLSRRSDKGSQGTIVITSKAIDTSGADSQGRSQAYCPKSSSGKHTFSSYGGPCSSCGFECTHLRADRSYGGFGYKQMGNGYHCPYFKCNVCGSATGLDPADKIKCTLGKWTQDRFDVSEGRHRAECKVCHCDTVKNCVYKDAYAKSDYAKHIHKKKCTVCGGNGDSVLEKHKFKSNKCTKCGFKRVLPGKAKIVSVKQKGRKKKGKRVEEAHWEDRGATVYWIPRKTYSYYKYVLSFNVKGSKTKYYEITAGKNNITINCKKKKSTYTFTSSKPIKKVTFYVTPVSSSGTPGKTVKKVVKLK